MHGKVLSWKNFLYLKLLDLVFDMVVVLDLSQHLELKNKFYFLSVYKVTICIDLHLRHIFYDMHGVVSNKLGNYNPHIHCLREHFIFAPPRSYLIVRTEIFTHHKLVVIKYVTLAL